MALCSIIAAAAAARGQTTMATPPVPDEAFAELEQKLNLPQPVDRALPTIFLIGDSTVRNDDGSGRNGQWGWGDPLGDYFDSGRVNVVNRAVGGRSSRTFWTQGHWARVREMMKPGDVVLMQFGHNDSGALNDDTRARGTIRGTGDESEEIDNLLTKQRETVRTYGWYLRQYIRHTKARGAIPVVLSPVPRNRWEGLRLARTRPGYAQWAEAVAAEEGAAFVDLHEIVARRYETMAEAAVASLFHGDQTHTSAAGARLNAEAVVFGLKQLEHNPAQPYFSAPAAEAFAAPREWTDPVTGHRVVRLSEEAGTASFYFHQHAYTADGRKLYVTTPDRGIATIDLETRETRKLVDGPVAPLVAGYRSGDIYYTRREELGTVTGIYATAAETGATRRVATLPEGAGLASLNADETLLLASLVDRPTEAPRNWTGARQAGQDGRFGQAEYQATWPDGTPMTFADAKELRLHEMLAAIRRSPPRALITISTKDGAVREVHRESEWLNHLQFSPTDPNLIMFCHEGPWHEVDRIWTIRTDGTRLQKVHTRTMNMEIAGHEFFAPDGRTIWYDLQTPRGLVFWLAGVEMETGRRTWYVVERDQWSVHFNVSPDGQLFAGDGGDEEMVARAQDGKWIYLFRPRDVPDVAGIKAPNADDLIHPGYLNAERLVNMAGHDYRLEPNVTFTPDMKWIVFRSNMHGPVHTYAVEIEREHAE